VVRGILEASGKVLAVFSGHYHDGGYQEINGIKYIVVQANAATATMSPTTTSTPQ
jgi:alkaline phosphatase